MKPVIILFLSALFIITSCKNNKNNPEESIDSRMVTTTDLNEVEVMILQKSPFNKEIVCNGKLTALEKSALTFGVGEVIVKKAFKNGEFVKKGAVIASLDKETLLKQLKQQEIQMEKATIDLEDKLISQGYKISDTATIPAELLKRAKLLSGYTSTQLELSNTKQSILKSDLRAPFSGVLTGIEHNLYDRISPGEEYCTLVNTSAFLAEFSVLESEIGDISVGKVIDACAFSSDEYNFEGKIFEIDPVVDEFGLIKVKALLKAGSGLMEGMNVKVRIRTSIPDKLVVPKSAVLIRQNKDIVFKYSGGKAIWTYINKEYENSSSYAIQFEEGSIGSLAAGDTIIVTGNLNLAHEADVQIKN